MDVYEKRIISKEEGDRMQQDMDNFDLFEVGVGYKAEGNMVHTCFGVKTNPDINIPEEKMDELAGLFAQINELLSEEIDMYVKAQLAKEELETLLKNEDAKELIDLMNGLIDKILNS